MFQDQKPLMDTHVKLLNLDLTQRQPQQQLQFALSHDQCWVGRAEDRQPLPHATCFRLNHDRRIYHQHQFNASKKHQCIVALQFDNDNEPIMSFICTETSFDYTAAPSHSSYKAPKFSHDVMRMAYWYVQGHTLQLLQSHVFARSVTLTFPELLGATFEALQRRGLYRNAVGSDLYRRDYTTGALAFVRDCSMLDFVTRLYAEPSAFGVIGNLNPVHANVLGQWLEREPSTRSPLLENLHDHFAYTNVLVNAKTGAVLTRTAIGDRNILARRSFTLSHVAAADKGAVPAFDAFLASQFGGAASSVEVPIKPRRRPAKRMRGNSGSPPAPAMPAAPARRLTPPGHCELLQYCLGSILSKSDDLVALQVAPVVFNLITPSTYSVQSTILLAILKALCRIDGLELQSFTGPDDVGTVPRVPSSTHVDVLVLRMAAVDAHHPALHPSVLSDPKTPTVILMTQSPAPSLPDIRVVNVRVPGDANDVATQSLSVRLHVCWTLIPLY